MKIGEIINVAVGSLFIIYGIIGLRSGIKKERRKKKVMGITISMVQGSRKSNYKYNLGYYFNFIREYNPLF